MHSVEFEVGQQYENRKGKYEVIAMDGDAMRIRWETGEEIDTTASMQSRILYHMQQGAIQLNLPHVKSLPKKNNQARRWQPF